MSNCKLSIQSISKQYKNNKSVALDAVSVDVQAGEFLAILGPSGCGKTTLLNLIGGLDRYTSGDLQINGNYTGIKISAGDALLLKSWDYVTIQQASDESWDYAKYQPYAENLIAKIKELCPGAEIVIQQTWAYNAADRRLNKESEWGFEQAEMHERARASYKKLQEATGFRVIPTGDAVAIARAKSNGSAELEPVNPGPDTIHLCKKGEYLQACVWFGFMYGKNPEEITYVPEELTEEEAKFYRTCAKEALTNGFW